MKIRPTSHLRGGTFGDRTALSSRRYLSRAEKSNRGPRRTACLYAPIYHDSIPAQFYYASFIIIQLLQCHTAVTSSPAFVRCHNVLCCCKMLNQSVSATFSQLLSHGVTKVNIQHGTGLCEISTKKQRITCRSHYGCSVSSLSYHVIRISRDTRVNRLTIIVYTKYATSIPACPSVQPPVCPSVRSYGSARPSVHPTIR